jgi:hypothetical protein
MRCFRWGGKDLSMKIPVLPKNQIVVQNKNPVTGETQFNLHPEWQGFFTQLIQELQQNVSNEGYFLPKQDSATVNQLNTDQSIRALLYDETEGVAKVNNAGAFKEIYTRPEEKTQAEIDQIPANQISGTWVYNTDTTKLLYGIGGVFKEVAYT